MRLEDDFEPLPGYMTTTEYAKEKDVDPGTILRHVWEGNIKAYQIGGIFVIPVAELDFYVRDRRKK